MGAEATRAVRARRREVVARVDRPCSRRARAATRRSLSPAVCPVAGREVDGPEVRARRRRVQLARREARRSLRAIGRLEAQVSVAELRVGAALVRLVAEGLSVDRAVAGVGLSRSVGRCYLRGAVNAPLKPEAWLSTGGGGGRASGEPAGHPEAGATRSPATTGSKGVS